MRWYLVKYTLFTIGLAIVALLSSCLKDESDYFDPYTGGYEGKLHKILLSSGSDTITWEFKYDENGRVVNTYTRYSNDDYVTTLSFSRNSAGQITHFVAQNEGPDMMYHINFNIDNDGKYISSQINANQEGKIYNASETYTYTGDRITKIEYVAPHYQYTMNYTYDNKGNIIRMKQNGTVEEATYDDKINPVESLDIPLFMAISPFSGCNKNNVLTSEGETAFGEGNATFTYSYNKSGKPASANIIGQKKNGTGFTYSLSYVYY